MKKVIAFIVTAAMICSLAACGGVTVSNGEKKVSVNTISEHLNHKNNSKGDTFGFSSHHLWKYPKL